MSVAAELLGAIRAAPHDDAPRLVYADWLIQQGDPRGEFIAAQIMRSIESREHWVALLRQHRDDWTANAKRIGASNVQFERGFIERIELHSIGGLLSRAPELVTWAPIPAVHVALTSSLATFAPDGNFVAISTTEPRGVQFAVHDVATAAVVLDQLITCTDRERSSMTYWFASPRRLIVELGMARLPVELAF